MQATVSQRRRLAAKILFVAVIAAGAAFAALRGQEALNRARAREMFLPELEATARRSPYDGELQALLGARRVQSGQTLPAARALQKAAAAGEDTAEVRLLWAACLAGSDRLPEALGVLRTGGKKPELEAALARLSALPVGTSGLEQARAIAPNDVTPLLTRYARPNLLSRFVGAGLETESEIFHYSDKGKDASLRWCSALLRSERYAEAEQMILPFRQQFPLDDAVCLAYGDALRGLKLPRKAGLEYIPVVQRNKTSLHALLGVGQICLDAGITPVAVDAFEKAVALAPQSADAHIGLGKAYLLQGLSYAKSVAAFEKGSQLAPERTEFFVPYTNALRMLFRWQEAEMLLRRRLADNPEDAEACHFLAVTLLDGKRTPDTTREAETLLKSSLELEPDGVTTAMKLGLLLESQSRMAEAIPPLQMVVGRDRYNLSVTQALARAFQKTGQTEAARDARDSAKQLAAYLTKRSALNDRLRVEPTNIKLHRALAELLENGGEDKMAQRHRDLAEYLVRDPKRATRDLYMLNKSVAQGIQVPVAPRDQASLLDASAGATRTP